MSNAGKAMTGKRFFRSERVVLEFDVPVAQAIQSLGARVASPGRSLSVKQDSLVGSVENNAVYLYRSVPGSRNSFRPTLYGNFSAAGNKATLTGEITLNRVIQKFIVLWCAIVAIVAVWTLLTILRNPGASWGSLIYIVFMLIACMVFFRSMIKKNSADNNWLKQEIVRAVNGH